jgi:hypothetical protein
MAIQNGGTAVNIEPTLLPTGFVKQVISDFSDYEYTQLDKVITILKSNVQNADKSITFQNIVDEITSQVSALIGADFDETANDIDCFSTFESYTSDFTLNSKMFTNGAINYLCTVNIYIKTTPVTP